jgi:hypothetical protein
MRTGRPPLDSALMFSLSAWGVRAASTPLLKNVHVRHASAGLAFRE